MKLVVLRILFAWGIVFCVYAFTKEHELALRLLGAVMIAFGAYGWRDPK